MRLSSYLCMYPVAGEIKLHIKNTNLHKRYCYSAWKITICRLNGDPKIKAHRSLHTSTRAFISIGRRAGRWDAGERVWSNLWFLNWICFKAYIRSCSWGIISFCCIRKQSLISNSTSSSHTFSNFRFGRWRNLPDWNQWLITDLIQLTFSVTS